MRMDLVEETLAEMSLERVFYFVALAVRTRAARARGGLKFCGCSLCRP
jgi:hypothetical protein